MTDREKLEACFSLSGDLEVTLLDGSKHRAEVDNPQKPIGFSTSTFKVYIAGKTAFSFFGDNTDD